MRSRAIPKLSNRRSARADSLSPWNTSCPAPPENRMRAAGYVLASAAISVMRSAASLSAMSRRAPDTTESSAPPSTTMPSGGPAVSVQAGKRCSSGRISALPNGVSPNTASMMMLAAARRRPARAKRVHISTTPSRPSVIAMLDGSAKKPKIFARTKNIANDAGSSLAADEKLSQPPDHDPVEQTEEQAGLVEHRLPWSQAQPLHAEDQKEHHEIEGRYPDGAPGDQRRRDRCVVGGRRGDRPGAADQREVGEQELGRPGPRRLGIGIVEADELTKNEDQQQRNRRGHPYQRERKLGFPDRHWRGFSDRWRPSM